MNTDELNEIENLESWDDGETRPAVKSPRAVVSVAFAREDFERIAEFARRHDMKTSELIRRAALDAVSPQRLEPATVVVTGAVRTTHPALEGPRAKIRVTLSQAPAGYATA